MGYIVQWENQFPSKDEDEDISINSPLEAAKEAMRDIQNGDTLGFIVTDTITKKKYYVDLSENDENAVLETK